MVNSNVHSLEQYHRIFPIVVTADKTLEPYEKVCVFKNDSASGAVTITLPNPGEGMGIFSVHYAALNSQNGVVKDDAGNTLATMTTAGDYVVCYSDGYGWTNIGDIIGGS